MPTLTTKHQSDIIENLSYGEEGLRPLTLDFIEKVRQLWNTRWGLIYRNPQIRRLRESISDQPSFFINKESWQLLIDGKQRTNDGRIINWVQDKYPNYEVLGFAFCVCLGQDVEGSFSVLGRLYLRVRTILGHKNNVVIDTQHIAYTSLHLAYQNKNLNCLTFVPQIDSVWKANEIISYINDEVIKFLNDNKQPITTLPDGLGKIAKNGNYFSKNKIRRILNESPKSLGTEVSIGTDGEKFTFYFKINPEYETYLPCPNPPICE